MQPARRGGDPDPHITRNDGVHIIADNFPVVIGGTARQGRRYCERVAHFGNRNVAASFYCQIIGKTVQAVYKVPRSRLGTAYGSIDQMWSADRVVGNLHPRYRVVQDLVGGDYQIHELVTRYAPVRQFIGFHRIVGEFGCGYRTIAQFVTGDSAIGNGELHNHAVAESGKSISRNDPGFSTAEAVGNRRQRFLRDEPRTVDSCLQVVGNIEGEAAHIEIYIVKTIGHHHIVQHIIPDRGGQGVAEDSKTHLQRIVDRQTIVIGKHSLEMHELRDIRETESRQAQGDGNDHQFQP